MFMGHIATSYTRHCMLLIFVLFGLFLPSGMIADSDHHPDVLRSYIRQTVIMDEHQDYDEDDERLIKEIWSTGTMIYKNIIDMSALYFSGILLDTNQLYDRIMFDCGKNLFHILRLLANYAPKMLQNKKLSWRVKAQKTGYIVSFLFVFYIWSQKVTQQKESKRGIDVDMYDHRAQRGFRADSYASDMLTHRPRPSCFESERL